MGWYDVAMRPLGSPAELEKRRWRAIDLLKTGLSISGVARRLGCSHSSVILWRDAVRRNGVSALKAKPAAGRPARLTPSQRKRLPALLLRGALSWGHSTDLKGRPFGGSAPVSENCRPAPHAYEAVPSCDDRPVSKLSQLPREH